MNPIHHTRSFRIAKLVSLLMLFLAIWALPPFALDGLVQIHDPSTIMQCDGKYYTYGTGSGSLVSDDGWTWRRGVYPRSGGGYGSGAAPDVIHIGDRYYLYVTAGGIRMIWSKTLDPNSPDYKWEDGGIVASKESPDDFMNPIDPGLLLDPDGKLWLTYGSYFGYIRVAQLDPKTGKRVDPNDKPVNIAINCEASDMIYHDGWYYLLATHGSCCRGADSGYNIRVGRSKKPTGPFIDHTGLDMLKGGGKLVVGSGGRFIGPGHFGLLDLGAGVQKFSMHYEADLDRGGASVLDIRPLLWKDGWPVAGENMKEGTYEIESVRTGTALELAVEGVPVGGRRTGRGGGAGIGVPSALAGGRAGQGTTGDPAQAAGAGGRGATIDPGRAGGTGGQNAQAAGAGAAGAGRGAGMFGGTGSPIPPQDVAEVSKNWSAGNIDIRMSNYMCQAQQKWAVTPVANAGGYFGSPYYRIAIAGTDRTLAVGEDGELVSLPAFTGGNEQLWRFDQLTDGTWRIMPKSASPGKESLALSAIGSSFAALAKFDPASNKQRWIFKTP